jgi:predicted aminopeptidase
MSGAPTILRVVVLLLASLACSGCTSVLYVVQAAQGQVELGYLARPIDEVVADKTVPDHTRSLLSRVASMKRFGEKHGLTPTKNYSEYVELDRPAVVWVVSACEPLRFQSKVWSFPIAGKVPYLGWFDWWDAESFAEDLREDGWDVHFRPAGAYSTLGWFQDPVLSSMIDRGAADSPAEVDGALGDLANVVLHESVHATLYLPGQSLLNESLADFVADRLTARYLDAELGAQSPERLAWEANQKDSDRRRALMQRAYSRLERLYASAAPDAAKLAEKARVLAELRRELGLNREINNATLAQFKTYSSGEAELLALLDACGGDFRRFLAQLRGLSADSFANVPPARVLAEVARLARNGCGR